MTPKRLEIDNDKVDKFGISDNEEIVRKSEKLKSQNLSKSRNLKGKKLFKSQKLIKSKKKLSKSRNLLNFGATEAKPKFLTLNAKTTFNCLRLAFIKTLIF